MIKLYELHNEDFYIGWWLKLVDRYKRGVFDLTEGPCVTCSVCLQILWFIVCVYKLYNWNNPFVNYQDKPVY